MRYFRCVTRFGKLCRAGIWPPLIATRRCSSVVTIVAPRLPLHPGFDGKLLQSSDLLFRSPCRPQCVIASKVGVSAVLRSTDVCRCDLDAATSTAGSMYPMESFRGISGWLRSVGMSQVS